MHQQPAPLLLSWYGGMKRDLPWRQTRDPYRIWISEIMLQQTRVETVKAYYHRFLTLFPTISDLANAPTEQVLKAWEGLGYYSRARNLQKAAQIVMREHGGVFPDRYEVILTLPGVGPYTGGAVASIAFGERVPAIDGNVYRVASRFFGVREDIGNVRVQKEIRALVCSVMPTERTGDFNQALMELGATHCSPTAPACDLCPLSGLCNAFAEGDAALLPIHEKKRPPKSVDVSVCLLTFQNSVLAVRRNQRMLGGMYVFVLIDEETKPERVQTLLEEQGLACAFAGDLGSARHVFTHRIWEMRLMHFRLARLPDQGTLDQLDARMVSAEALAALPLPTAMKAAREKALQLLQADTL